MWMLPVSFYRHKQLLLSLTIFILIMCILALPYTNWGFVNEDHAFILWSKLKSFKDVMFLFGPHDIGEAFVQPNSTLNAPTFFSVLYRPMQFVLFGLETILVGVSPYNLLLMIIAIHALISVALFNLFLYFFNFWLAFLGAFFFALHPSTAFWIGIFTCQIYIVDLMYLLIVVMLLKKYLDTKRLIYYLLSCFIALLSIFAKETLIVLPVWIIAAVFMYRGLTSHTFYSMKNVWYGVRISIGYWSASFLYLIARALLFPVSAQASSLGFNLTVASFLARQKERLGDWMSYVCDFLYVGVIPSGNRLLKGFLVFVIVSLILWPFMVEKEKRKYLVFLVMSMLFFTWPAVLLYYQPRYLYVALPFFFLIVLTALTFYMQRFYRAKKVIVSCLSVLLVFNASIFIWRQRQKETMLHTITTAFKDLAHDPAINGRSIYFVGIPMLWFGAGNAQAVWFYKPSQKEFAVYSNNGFFAEKTEPFYELKSHELQVMLVDEGVRMKSRDPENLFFSGSERPAMQNCVIVHQTNSHGKPCDITAIIDENVLAQNPLFVTWDYVHQKFKIV